MTASIDKGKVSDKEEALLRATLELVNNNGFHGAPMSKIAKEARVSVGTIYLYFQSKQELINKLYLKVKQAFASKTFERFDESKPVREAFEQIWYAMADFKINNREEALFLAQCDNSPIVDEAVLEQGLRYIKPLLSLWERGRSEGVLKDVSPYMMYAFTVYSLTFLLQQSGSNDRFTFDESKLKQAFGMAWDSIRRDDTR